MAAPSSYNRIVTLCNLLLEPRGYTRDQLQTLISDYQPRNHHDSARIEKLFERDRAAIERMGCTIATLSETGGEAEAGERMRYRIVDGAPDEPLSFTPTFAERLLLRQASAMWDGDPTLATLSSHGVTKLSTVPAEQHGADTHRDAPIPVQLRGASDACAHALIEAALTNACVTFDYQLPTASEPYTRNVQVLSAISFDGTDLVHCWDLDRDAERTFLIQRIARSGSKSGVSTLPHPGLPTSQLITLTDSARTAHRLRQHFDKQRMLVAVRPGSLAEQRVRSQSLDPCTTAHPEPLPSVRAPEGWERHVLRTFDYALTVHRLLRFGADIVVLSPEAAVTPTINALKQLRAVLSNRGTASASAIPDSAETR